MSRHVDNLERLFNRLQLCIGTDDELTQQVARDLQRIKRRDSDRNAPYGGGISYQKWIDTLKRESRSDDTSSASH